MTDHLHEIGVGPWQGEWPTDERYDPDLLEAGRKVRELDSDRLRDAAVKAQGRARETYDELVTRGERVAAGERSPIRVTARVERDEPAPAPVPPAGTAKRKRAPRTAGK